VNQLFETVTTIALAIVTLGMVAVVVSKKAQTPQVIQASGSAFSNAMAVAESPVTGAQYRVDLSYPQSSPFGFSMPDLSNGFGYG
jgi:PRD1 phage membrane DNA delivery